MIYFMAFLLLLIMVPVSEWITNRRRDKEWSEHGSFPLQVNGQYDENEEMNETQDPNQQSESTTDSNVNTENVPQTSSLMFNILCELGCQPVFGKDGTLAVSYQGEVFQMLFGGMYAQVWDPYWANIHSDDPNLPMLRDAVNETNFDFGPTVLLSKPDKDGEIAIHSRRDIMIHPACPDNVNFVKSVLDSFFEKKRTVRRNYENINIEKQERLRNHRPVGFDVKQTDSVEAETLEQ